MVNFKHPCPGTTVTSKFGYRTIGGKREWHQGVDFAKKGTVPIYASADGKVRDAWGANKSSYGNVVFLQHNIDGKRMDTTYAHLKTISVRVGQSVKQGDLIGYMGNTGRSSGQHLHFEIHNGPWMSGQPNAVDPLKYIDVTSKQTTKPKDEVKKSLKSGVYKTEAEAEKVIATIRRQYKLSEKYNYAFKDGSGYRWRTGSFAESDAKKVQNDIIKKGLAKVVHLI